MHARRPLAALLLAGLIALAGCSGALNPADSATGAPDDGTAPTTGDVAADQLPPGVDADGVADRSALLAAHRAALSETGYVLSVSSNATVNASGRTQSVSSRQDVRVEEGLRPFLVRTEQDAALASTRSLIWGNESTALLNVTQNGRTQYRPFPASLNVSREVTISRTIGSFLAAGNYSVAGTAERGGETVVLLHSTEPRAVGNATQVQPTNVTNFSATVAVAPDGLVRSYRLQFTAETSRGTTTLDAAYDLAKTGEVSVERPAWVDEALANVTQASFSLSAAEGTHLELTHEGGDALDAGSMVLVRAGEGANTVRLSEAFAPGETRYFYRPSNDSGFRVATDAPAASNATALSGEVSVLVVTSKQEQVANLTASAGGA